jgi:acyl dehydratase
MKPGQPHKEVRAGEELHEARHPDPPHAGGEIDTRVTLRELEEFLGTIDEIAGPQPEEPEREWRKGGGRQADDGIG